MRIRIRMHRLHTSKYDIFVVFLPNQFRSPNFFAYADPDPATQLMRI